ncbi:MAG: 3-phosphoshikimate 1-carboxyvinyltransferase [Flavobacteriaceae bacterium]|nr:3-phosphoshikimate 1-carboxyvinyltransferase [Flavobacteriaceae bacterium]
MNLSLEKSKIHKSVTLSITGSKSESNRLLLLQALWDNISIDNLSNSDDSVLMQNALRNQTDVINIHHAGTAMRFLTAYFSLKVNSCVTLTGSQRMQERPIGVLVDALITLGADIKYLKEEGYPPIQIKGKLLETDEVSLSANVSSQYISALLLIGAKFNNGLMLHLLGDITSVPYIEMTLALLNQIGVETQFENQTITVEPLIELPKPLTLVVESDWSSASYFYSIVALSEIGTVIKLNSYKKNSLQGDAVLAEIYQAFGVETSYESNTISIEKIADSPNGTSIDLDLSNAPDIAQTIAVTCLGLKLRCKLRGLHTLKIKETDRLLALKTEIEKFGTSVSITDKTLEIETINPLYSGVKVATYNDHRMAMAFAPLALKKSFTIMDAEVVSKSFPDFWKDLKRIGFSFSE